MSTIRIANAPCSWGVLEFDIGEAAAGAAQVLQEISASGYAGTELGDWGFLPSDPTQLRAMLGKVKLDAVAAFVPVALAEESAHAAGVEAALNSARLLAEVAESALIVLADDNGKHPVRTREAGRIRPEHGLSDKQWQTFAKGAEDIASAVRDETGGRVAFHPHCAGFVETQDEINTLLRLTDPSLIGLCLDTGHCLYGGGDPVEVLKTHSDRIWHMHFKDVEPRLASVAREGELDYFDAVASGVFCELGLGSVDFAAVVETLATISYEGWIVVEQDVLPGMGTPIESARRNREFFTTLGF